MIPITEPTNFTSELDVRYLDGRRWLILAPFDYHLGAIDGVEVVKVGRGEITDFASIPRPLKLIWPSPGGPWDKPAVVHDSLHVRPFVLNEATGTWRALSFEEVNAVFLEAMIVTNTNALTRQALYDGVQSDIGRLLWNRHRQADAEQLARLTAAQWWRVNPWLPVPEPV